MTIFTDLISVSELDALQRASACNIVDCRFNLMDTGKGREEFLQGHIPGAVYAHLDDDLASPVTPESGRHPLPDVDTFVSTLVNWGIDNESQVVVYDHGSGAIAARLWWLLRWLGHEKVAVLDGGFAAWEAAGGALATDVTLSRSEGFRAVPDATMIVTTDEIAQALETGGRLDLVDARDAARFRGEVEPIDPVAGHIPGARNLPFSQCSNADGTWLPADKLKAAWKQLVPEGPERPLIAMCGSGVTACHLLISARLAGRAEPRLYVGSWSEWIRDDRRPVETLNRA